MLSKHKRILNLIVILGLMLVMLPHRSSAAQLVGSGPISPNQPDDLEEELRLPFAGPERELDDTIQAGQKALSISGWHFYPYFDKCQGLFKGYAYGKIGPKGTLSEWCFVTFPLLLPNGSTFDSVFFNYYDADPDRDLMFRIVKTPYLGDVEGETLLEKTSSGADGYGYIGSGVYHKISLYDTYQIIIMFPPGANQNLLFSSINIEYSEPVTLPFGIGFPAIQN